MVGISHSKWKLNKTLLFIVKELHKQKVKKWFLGYGTLLGIVRNNSCIEGDDDIDIVVDHTNYDIIKEIVMDNKLGLENNYGVNNSRNIIKTLNTEYCSVDFYMSKEINGGKHVYDMWENVIWSNCYDLVEFQWNGEILYLPKNYEENLKNRYGLTWRIPKQTKGLKKKII